MKIALSFIAIFLLGVAIYAQWRTISKNEYDEVFQFAVSKTNTDYDETSTDSKLVSNSINNNLEAKVEIIKRFAENYEPRSTNRETIPSTPNPNKEVLNAIDVLARAQSRKHEKYIVLIFIRLERFHTEHFKQTYDLGDNALAREFYKLIGKDYQSGGEPGFSHLAGVWIKANPKLLEYSPIEKEIRQIKAAEGKIEQETITRN